MSCPHFLIKDLSYQLSSSFDQVNLETCRAATSRTSAYRDDDEDVEDAVTSNPGMTFANLSLLSRPFCWSIEFRRLILFAAPPNVFDLPDDDEDMPLRPMGRRSRKTSIGKVPQSTPVTEPVIQETGDANRASVTFAAPFCRVPSLQRRLHRFQPIHRLHSSLRITSKRTKWVLPRGLYARQAS